MTTLTPDELAEFEEQIRLQEEAQKDDAKSKSRTRVDEDGTVMEWDDEKRAWFPKIDDDFIAKYNMSFGNFDEQKHESSVMNQWQTYLKQTEELKSQKGDNDPEVIERTEIFQKALQEYYNSDSYRQWYDHYIASQNVQSNSKINHKKTAKRPLIEEKDPEEALLRAEAEQREGIPLPEISQSELKEQIEKQETSKKKQSGPAWYDLDEAKTTHVYVSGLPTEDYGEDQFNELMSKCGLIAHDPLNNKPRSKLYRNPDKTLKGDGRCCYIKIESVDLALQILDGMILDEKHTLHVERAKFQPKGEFDPNKRRRLTQKEKKKMKEHEASLFKWGMDASRFIRTKKERTIVLKNVFDETDFAEDVTLIPKVKELVRVQCAKCGNIKKIIVYDANKEGIVTVQYHSAEEADAAIAFLNKALFSYTTNDGRHQARQLTVNQWDGKTRFDVKESEEEESERLARWNAFLEGTNSKNNEDCDTDKSQRCSRTPSDLDSDAGGTDDELIDEDEPSEA